MTTREFKDLYWRNYMEIEKEFMKTFYYAKLCEDNMNVYSNAYIKLLLEICSELEAALDLLCTITDDGYVHKPDDDLRVYKKKILNKLSDFPDANVEASRRGIIVKPWERWKTNKTPEWWTAYNKVKHERYRVGFIDEAIEGGETEVEYYKYANQRNVLSAIAALYQIHIYCFYYLAAKDDEYLKTPVPGSKLFKLSGEKWDEVTFYSEYAFMTDPSTGMLKYYWDYLI